MAFKKECVPWNKGLKGYGKGRKHTTKTKRKMSENHKGENNPFYGKHHSKEMRRKMSETRSDENNNNWKGGITSERNHIRTSIESRLWREAVFSRDSWTCQKCKQEGKYINAHHIMNFSDYPELRFAIDNGITFCEECHKKFHKEYGKESNNKEQIILFFEGE